MYVRAVGCRRSSLKHLVGYYESKGRGEAVTDIVTRFNDIQDS